MKASCCCHTATTIFFCYTPRSCTWITFAIHCGWSEKKCANVCNKIRLRG